MHIIMFKHFKIISVSTSLCSFSIQKYVLRKKKKERKKGINKLKYHLLVLKIKNKKRIKIRMT